MKKDRNRLRVRRSFLTLLAMSMAACVPTPRSSTANGSIALIGSQGGALQGPNGAELSVPAGALPTLTPVALVLPPVGSTPALPAWVTAVGATYEVLPHDALFAPVAMLSVPFDAAQVPASVAPQLLTLNGETKSEWQAVTSAQAIGGSHMSAPLSSAGSFVVVVPLPQINAH